MQVTMKLEKETKNTFKYSTPAALSAFRELYIQKSAFVGRTPPQQISVSVVELPGESK